jgi:hypothetical protein
VLLDGPRWAARESAGDRDGLPRAVLTQQMGWPGVARIWLPEWLRDADAVVQSLAAQAAGLSHAAPREGVEPPGPRRALDASPLPVAHPDESGQPEFPTTELAYEPLRSAGVDERRPSLALDREEIDGPRFADENRATFVAASLDVRHAREVLDATTRRATQTIAEELQDVVEKEGPILLDRLARITARRFDLGRVRGTRAEQILRSLPAGLVHRSANGDEVAWPRPLEPNTYAGYRVPGEVRDVADVPYEELRNGMAAVVRSAFGIDEADLLKETARLFGWSRLGSNVRERLAGVLEAATREGVLVQDGGRIRGGAAPR